MRKSALTLIAVAIVLSFGGSSKSSPTEPTFTASLYGTVAICGYPDVRCPSKATK